MAISGIASPVAGTVITTAFVDLNYKTPLLYLVALLGGFGGQPGAANKVPVSNGSESGAWGQAPTDAIADLAVTTGKIATGAVTAAKIGTDAVTAAAIQAGAVGTAKLADGAVLFAKLGDAQVTEQKLLDGAVTAAKLAANAVTQVKVADAAIGTAELIDANVTAAKLATDAVETAKIKDLNVTTGKLADQAVTAAKIADATITEAKVQPNTLTNQSMASGMSVANLGYTPARIAAGTYIGDGGTSPQQRTVGFAVKGLMLQSPSTDTIYLSASTINSVRIATGDSVQGSAAVHLHASDGFVVADNSSAQGNVASVTYYYVAIG